MKIEESSIADCFLIEHNVYPDDRGIFKEWFKARELAAYVPDFSIQQASFSKSRKGVIRGIHYSLAPIGQAKLVTCTEGKITDVLIDLRIESPTYLKIQYSKLSEDSGKVIYIASGVGHGFVVETEAASLVYLTSSVYSPEFEKSICPTDPELGINWPNSTELGAIISPADSSAPTLHQAKEAGNLPAY